MEAIARNLPAVATDVGGVRKMLQNEEGIIIKPKSVSAIISGIKQVLALKKRDIRKGAEKFSWKLIIKQTYEDYLK